MPAASAPELANGCENDPNAPGACLPASSQDCAGGARTGGRGCGSDAYAPSSGTRLARRGIVTWALLAASVALGARAQHPRASAAACAGLAARPAPLPRRRRGRLPGRPHRHDHARHLRPLRPRRGAGATRGLVADGAGRLGHRGHVPAGRRRADIAPRARLPKRVWDPATTSPSRSSCSRARTPSPPGTDRSAPRAAGLAVLGALAAVARSCALPRAEMCAARARQGPQPARAAPQPGPAAALSAVASRRAQRRAPPAARLRRRGRAWPSTLACPRRGARGGPARAHRPRRRGRPARPRRRGLPHGAQARRPWPAGAARGSSSATPPRASRRAARTGRSSPRARTSCSTARRWRRAAVGAGRVIVVRRPRRHAGPCASVSAAIAERAARPGPRSSSPRRRPATSPARRPRSCAS